MENLGFAMKSHYSKIIINGRFLSQKLTGVQRYALEITKALDSIIESTEIPFELAVPSDVNESNLPKLNNKEKLLSYKDLKEFLKFFSK